MEDGANRIQWVPGELDNADAVHALVGGCQAVVHAALDHSSDGPRTSGGFTLDLARRNVKCTLDIIEAARRLGVGRFVFISSCAVYDHILGDRPLDEAHPLWPGSHYGAHKAAIEAFVHSYGAGEVYSICALRPSGIYGLAHPIEESKWYDLVSTVVRGETVTCERGGKEVHAADVAQGVEALLNAPHIAGEAYNCCDRYVSEHEVAVLAKKISGSKSEIKGAPTQPKHQIVTDKLRSLGVRFGGEPLLEETVGELVAAVRAVQAVSA